MQPSEVSVSSNPFPYSAHFTMNNQSNTRALFELSRYSNPLCNFYNIPTPYQLHDQISPHYSSCISSTSTSDEADGQQLSSLINERKQRRIISNRESARRSRMRKQRHLDELLSQVVRLRNENHQLIGKLNHISDNHDKAVQENALLKEEASELRQMLCDMQLCSPLNMEDVSFENGLSEN